MSLETIHQATCDRCKAVETVNSENVVPNDWMRFDHRPNWILCVKCWDMLNTFLDGANIRKPRTPKVAPDAAE